VAEILFLAGIAALVWLTYTAVRRRERNAAIHALVQTFGPAQAAAFADPAQLIAWHPLAEASRKLFPEAFAALDAATGARFPFPTAVVERAHAKVSSDWLAWEKAHDEEYRIRAAAAEQELARETGDAAALARARLDRIQLEKIERYQQRYEEYVRTSKALQALLE
jgi:uncharacterized protein with LGFP repeats